MMKRVAHWWEGAVIYELYVDKFAGNLKGLTEKLNYLARLGVNGIWILPHYPSPMIDDGYDVSDYKGVRSDLGTIEDFRKMMQRAKQLGIKVIIDLVLNHTSTKHPWFIEAASSKQNKTRNYYLWSDTGKELAMAHNPFPTLKDKNWIVNPPTGDYYFSTFYPEQADLNWDNPEVFREMTEVMSFWLDLGVDGFRVDSIANIIKREGTRCVTLPESHEIVKRFRSWLDEKYPEALLLAESFNRPAEAVEYLGNGNECHSTFNFEFAVTVLLVAAKGESEKVKKVIADTAKLLPRGCQWAYFLRNHDQIPFWILNDQDAEELREVVDAADPSKRMYMKNSEVSMRLATLLGGDKKKIIDGFGWLLSAPGMAIIYYGDEIGMLNSPIPPEEKDTRRSLRGKFDWAEAEKQINNKESLWSQVRELIRKRLPLI